MKTKFTSCNRSSKSVDSTRSVEVEETLSYSVKVGTTNSDGTGSSSNLDDSYEILSETSTENHTLASYTVIAGANDLITVTADYWNADEQKEVSIDAINTDVITTDFVDVDINLQDSDQGVSVQVANTKRGQIDTGSGDDSISIGVYTNDAGWSNTIEVNSGDGDDTILMYNVQNSQYTMFSIDAGDGDDVINLAGILANDDDSDEASERSIDAGAGDDIVYGSQGNDYINGGRGDDVLYGNAGNDEIYAGSGDDTIYAGTGSNYIDAGRGDDVVYGSEDADTIYAGSGADTIYAGNGDNIIFAENGSDTIYTGSGDDIIDAGNGHDTIYAGDGDNEVYAGNGSDLTYTGSGIDYIDAGNGADFIYAGAGDDTIVFDENDILVDGGSGFDALIISEGSATIDSTIVSNIEVIVGETGETNELTTDIEDGLIIALGGDQDDAVIFNSDTDFTLDDSAQLTDSEIEGLIIQGVDYELLSAYTDSQTGFTVWSDIELTA